MSRHLLSVVLIALSVSSVWAQDVKVDLMRLTERREKSFENDDRMSGFGEGIDLQLRVTGKDVEGARSYSDVKLTKAIDDAGTDLTDSDQQSFAFGTQEITGFGQPENEPGFRFDVRLPKVPARKATALKLVEGSVNVTVGGEKKIVEVPIKPETYGKAVEDPALKAVGVTFTLTDPKKGEAEQGGSTVPAIIEGNADAIKVTIVDAQGEEIGSGAMWGGMGGKRSISYFVNGALPEGAKVRIEAWPGQKVIKVPFKLENVALP